MMMMMRLMMVLFLLINLILRKYIREEKGTQISSRTTGIKSSRYLAKINCNVNVNVNVNVRE